jgi:phenylpropionate dioxygenase-like ring-hydroxylating dioxygenase large terminal subunit
MFVKNSWYVAAWSPDVGSERPLGRTILNEPVVLFRTRDGKVAALEGRCAHRRMPLEHGKIVGDELVCCYHGLAYGASGRCVRIPGQSSVPTSVAVKRYPAVERYGAVWLWMGEEKLADERKIFACPKVGPSGENGHPFYFHVKANYLYINDNLSDLLHQAYLHNPSFGGNTFSLGEAVPEIERDEDRIEVRWNWSNVPVPGVFAKHGRIDGNGDGWNHSTYKAPSFYINHTGFAARGTGSFQSNRPQGDGKISLTIYQLITPETERSTHFFKIVHCGWPDSLMPQLRNFIVPVNEEDVWACEEQQRMEDLDPTTPLRTIPTDRAVVAMRRVLDQILRVESRQAKTKARRRKAA